MKCTEAQRLLHLDRPGERLDQETTALNKHLATCPTCTAEAQMVERIRESEIHLRRSNDPVPDLARLRARVMSATIPQHADRPRRLPKLRLVYVSSLLALVVWFGVDQWRIRTAYLDLNQRLSQPEAITTGPQIVYTVNLKAAQSLTSRSDLLPPDMTDQDTWEVPQSTAVQWLEGMPSHFIRTATRNPAQQAQISEALRILRTAVDITIRYRSKGA